MKIRKKPDLITEEEFNRMVAEGGHEPDPQSDSPGDTAEYELDEAKLGETYPEEEVENDEHIVAADIHGGAQGRQQDEAHVRDKDGVVSSPRPDPGADRDAPTSTH